MRAPRDLRLVPGLPFGLVLAWVPAIDAAPINLWAKAAGDSLAEEGSRVAVDRQGSVVVTGRFGGMVNFGGSDLASAGHDDVFLVQLAPLGNHVWSHRYGSVGHDRAWGLGIDGASNIFVGGDFEGVVSFGGASLSSAGASDAFLAKYDHAGNHVWSRRFGGAGGDVTWSVAVDGDDDVLLAGSFRGTVSFGGDSLSSAGGTDVFLAKLDPDGEHVWSKRFGGPGDNSVNCIAAGAEGNVLVTGAFLGDIDFGGGTLSSVGGLDVFAARFDPEGNHLWSARYGDDSLALGMAITAGAQGSMILIGTFTSSIDFGGGPLTSVGGADVFLATLDAAGGHVSSGRFGGADGDLGMSAAAEADSVVITGFFSGAVDFGGGTLTSSGAGDLFLAKYGPANTHLWSAAFGGGGTSDLGRSVAVGGSGELLLTGSFGGSADFGTGPLAATGLNPDVFVARFAEVPSTPWPAEPENQATNLTSLDSDFTTDLSGATWNPVTRTLWVCRNGPGNATSKIWALVEGGPLGFQADSLGGLRGEWTGFGDLESLTQADYDEAHVVYGIVEGEERIKAWDLSTYGTAVLLNDWNTTPHLPLNGMDGSEGITFVPDESLTQAGFVDASGALTTSSGGMGGLMFVGNQNGGGIFVFDLNRVSNTFTFVGEYRPVDVPGWETAGLEFDRATGLLYARHDASINLVTVMDLTSRAVAGQTYRVFNVVETYTGLGGNLEGFAVMSTDDCESGRRGAFVTIDGGGSRSLLWFKELTAGCPPTAAPDVGQSVRVELGQNRPNPFGTVTSIPFAVEGGSRAEVRIYDVQGRLIRVLGAGGPGGHSRTVLWDGRNRAGERAAAGVYFYELRVDGTQVAARKAVVAR